MAYAIPLKSKRSACTEENELLSATSIKMSEAPFGRSDSEDDIVEDYDDVISFQTPCFRGRTGLEKVLAVCLILALLVIIGLAVGLTRPQVVPVTKYCKSSPCVQASSSVLSTVDWSVNPCSNFFQFACGQWLRSTPIPRGYQHWDRFQELSGNNLFVLSNLIKKNDKTGQSFLKTRDFYDSCLGVTVDNNKAILQQFASLVDDSGGWSNSVNDSFDKWDYLVSLEYVHRRGAWPLFKITVEVDERAPTRQNIIKINIGETVLPSDLKPFANRTSPHSGTGNSTSDDEKYFPHSLKDEEKLRQVFLDETVHLFTSFGMLTPQATKRADDMMALEEIVMRASHGYHHMHDRFSMYNVMTLANLQHSYPLVNWVQYFAALGFNVTGDTEVVVLHPDYLAKLTSDLKEYTRGSDDKKRVLRDYLAISLIRSFKPYFDKSLFELTETEEEDIEEPWKRCTFYTNRALSFATGALYVKGTKSEDSVQKIEKLIIFVRNAFKDYLLRKFWMGKSTRIKAEKKVDAIIDKISYPSYILNMTFLDNYYRRMVVAKNDWFSNLLSWRRFTLSNMNSELNAVPDRKTSWLRPPVTVNAYYSATRNDVIFPIAMFHLPFYIPDGPSAVNFGAMGSIIGHEITHAFDFQGRQYDGQGKLSDWWDEQTASNFETTTTCMKDQYSGIKVRGVNIDGDFTLDENIADNGGLRAAVYAYQMYIDKYGEELMLPGLNMSMYQVLFTSYAQMYCSKWTDSGLFLHLLRDPHSPGIARVNGVLSNSQTFNWAFKCPLDTKMNPQEEDIEEPWKRCTFYTNRALSFATGALYVKGTKSEDSVQKIEKLIIFVRNAFKDYLLRKFWMGKSTRIKAEKKVDAIIDKISYPSYILNMTFLDNYYRRMVVAKNDWFSNLLSWRRFTLSNMNSELNAVPDRKTSWLRPPVTVNAYYSATRNDVIFPIAMFHLPFYIPDGPSAVNFGAMGSIIGHEITHAFDFQGRQYDGQGKLSDWWDEQTASNFETTTTCMKDQYSGIKVRGVNIDGDFTLDENIADNGGLRAAVYAYQMYIDKYGEELMLPGLNMSMYQVLFTSYAQMYCSKWTDSGLFLHLLRDPHSPGIARVNGVLSNSQTFNWAFKCPLDTKMNPRVKCEVW